jgi:hypothetical protein
MTTEQAKLKGSIYSTSGIVGILSGQQNTTGTNNTATGTNNTATGTNNTAIGYTALVPNILIMVYICAPYGLFWQRIHSRFSSGSTDKRLTIGKKYSVHENYGTGHLRYEFIDDFGIGMSLDAINFCTVDEWRSKQLDSILDEK